MGHLGKRVDTHRGMLKEMHGLEGTTLGRYRLQRRLGQGGMSEVYLAYDELMHRDVAIKIVSSSHADYIERFQREAEAIGNLHHNHILPAFDYGKQELWHYLVMPYIEHETLNERLERENLSLEEAGKLLQQIASGLQYAHEQGIVHRDIKPSNILMRDEHHVYLADFGLAKAVNGGDSVTQIGILLGTPEYMAPELADGPASRSSDLYALGILLYQMVTGRLPFTGDTSLAIFLKQMHEQPIPPSRLNPAIPYEVEQVILRALDKDPRRRYRTPNELAETYMQALDDARLLEYAGSLRTPASRKQVVLHDSAEVEMPPLYDAGEIMPELPPAQGSMHASVEPHYRDRVISPADGLIATSSRPEVQEEKLVLPAYSLTTLESASPVTTITQQPARSTPALARRRRPMSPRSARESRNAFVLTSFMGIGLLLIIVSVILFAVFNYRNNIHAQRKAAPILQAAITSQPARTDVTQTTSTPSAKPSSSVTTPLTGGQAAVATARAISSSTPLLADDLSSSIIGGWNVDGNACIFTGGSYHVLVKQADYLVQCVSNILSYDNVALQVDVSLLSGNDAGLIFRANGQQFYDFEINDQGEFFFRLHDTSGGGEGSYTYLIPATKSAAIAAGKQKNTLLVIANGSNFKLFINDIFVGEQQDSTYTAGQVGFVTGTQSSTSSGEASFANFKVFQVS
jgi:serine/threonine protein kinase